MINGPRIKETGGGRLSESDTCMRYIDPMLKDAGWSLENIRREFQIAPGRIVPDGRSGRRNSPLKADYVLTEKNFKVAVVEAKAYDEPHDKGIQQAIKYAEKLDLKFAYATNGRKIEEYDFNTRIHHTITKFPSPSDLLERLKENFNFTDEQMNVITTPPERDANDPSGSIMVPRYYQENAIQATLAAILGGKSRILLTLATGTGKTFIAYQIAKKLWKTNSPRPKILFLADRNVLLDQAKNSAFASFGEARHRIQRRVETAYEM